MTTQNTQGTLTKPNTETDVCIANCIDCNLICEERANTKRITKGKYIISPMSGGYWSIEEFNGGSIELVQAWISKEDVRAFMSNTRGI